MQVAWQVHGLPFKVKQAVGVEHDESVFAMNGRRQRRQDRGIEQIPCYMPRSNCNGMQTRRRSLQDTKMGENNVLAHKHSKKDLNLAFRTKGE